MMSSSVRKTKSPIYLDLGAEILILTHAIRLGPFLDPHMMHPNNLFFDVPDAATMGSQRWKCPCWSRPEMSRVRRRVRPAEAAHRPPPAQTWPRWPLSERPRWPGSGDWYWYRIFGPRKMKIFFLSWILISIKAHASNGIRSKILPKARRFPKVLIKVTAPEIEITVKDWIIRHL